jgi:hypothetical protein
VRGQAGFRTHRQERAALRQKQVAALELETGFEIPQHTGAEGVEVALVQQIPAGVGERAAAREGAAVLQPLERGGDARLVGTISVAMPSRRRTRRGSSPGPSPRAPRG